MKPSTAASESDSRRRWLSSTSAFCRARATFNAARQALDLLLLALRDPSARRRVSAITLWLARLRSGPRVKGTTQYAHDLSQPSMMVI